MSIATIFVGISTNIAKNNSRVVQFNFEPGILVISLIFHTFPGTISTAYRVWSNVLTTERSASHLQHLIFAEKQDTTAEILTGFSS